jgi:hypothetical protein
MMPKNPTNHNKRVLEYKMNDLQKTKPLLKGNLWNLFTVLIALFDTEVKNLVKELSES